MSNTITLEPHVSPSDVKSKIEAAAGHRSEAARCTGIGILANNHVLDYGPEGLFETTEMLRKPDIRAVGAGRSRDEAMSPVVHALPGAHRVPRVLARVESLESM